MAAVVTAPTAASIVERRGSIACMKSTIILTVVAARSTAARNAWRPRRSKTRRETKKRHVARFRRPDGGGDVSQEGAEDAEQHQLPQQADVKAHLGHEGRHQTPAQTCEIDAVTFKDQFAQVGRRHVLSHLEVERVDEVINGVEGKAIELFFDHTLGRERQRRRRS